MIDVAGTIIQSMTFGTDNIKGIWFGTDKIWPVGTVTTALTNTSVYYSSGTMINAAGSNYAYIQGTLITYIDGQEDSISGITINNAYGDWVIGTITAGSGNTQGGGTFYTKACIVAKRTPVTSTATVNVGRFAWQWMPPVTGQTPTSYSETNISFTISPDSTVKLKPLGFDDVHTYYGAYMYSPAAGMTLSPHPNLQVNSVSSFSVEGG